jgi:hypothetical protein
MRRFHIATLLLCLCSVFSFAQERLILNRGNYPNDGNGDTPWTFIGKANTNFEALFNRTANLSNNAAVAALALGDVSTNAAAWRAVLKQTPDTIYVTWYSTDSTLTAAEINEALTAGAGKRIVFPSSATYNVDATLYPRSNSHLVGHGAVLRNASTNTSGLILMQVTNQADILIEGFTFDAVAGSHYNNGNLWVRGSTNVLTRNCTLKNGGYLANYVVASFNSAPSVNCDIEGSDILDQRYGGSGLSTANLSVAEGSIDCDVRHCTIDYPTVGTAGYSYVALGEGHPNAPTLAISLDRAFNARVIGCTIRNRSGQTNLTGLMIEDNSGATNIYTTVESTVIDGLDTGTAFAYLNGRATYTDCTFKNNTRWAVRLHQVEEADQHKMESVTFQSCRFLNNYPAPTMGTNELGYWRNRGGQISFTANPPYRLVIDGCEFDTYSSDAAFSHILWGAGDLVVKDSLFRRGAYGIRVADPVQVDPITPNSLYNAEPRKRAVFSSRNNRFADCTSPVYGCSDTFAADNWYDGSSKYFTEDSFYIAVTTNAPTRLFSIKTVDTTRSDVGTSGSYYCVVDLLVSNDAPTSTHQFGSVAGRGMSFAFAQAIAHPDTVNTSPVISLGMTPQAQVGARGFENLAVTLVNSPYHTTDVKLTLTGQGDVTQAAVFCRVRVLHSGFFTPPCILR